VIVLFVILVYDFNEKRVGKALKIARKYLHWVQNSVFEGEITQANYTKLKMELQSVMNPNEDSVIFYTFRTQKYSKREEFGLKKGGDEFIL
jgi:CRISPR-associated protein Cas2